MWPTVSNLSSSAREWDDPWSCRLQGGKDAAAGGRESGFVFIVVGGSWGEAVCVGVDVDENEDEDEDGGDVGGGGSRDALVYFSIAWKKRRM